MNTITDEIERAGIVMKIQFGYKRKRYRGIAKNAAQVFMLIGLVNLYLQRGCLLALQDNCV